MVAEIAHGRAPSGSWAKCALASAAARPEKVGGDGEDAIHRRKKWTKIYAPETINEIGDLRRRRGKYKSTRESWVVSGVAPEIGGG